MPTHPRQISVWNRSGEKAMARSVMLVTGFTQGSACNRYAICIAQHVFPITVAAMCLGQQQRVCKECIMAISLKYTLHLVAWQGILLCVDEQLRCSGRCSSVPLQGPTGWMSGLMSTNPQLVSNPRYSRGSCNLSRGGQSWVMQCSGNSLRLPWQCRGPICCQE